MHYELMGRNTLPEPEYYSEKLTEMENAERASLASAVRNNPDLQSKLDVLNKKAGSTLTTARDENGSLIFLVNGKRAKTSFELYEEGHTGSDKSSSNSIQLVGLAIAGAAGAYLMFR